MTLRDKFLGCLLGGAVGDALGAPVEFMRLSEIRRQFGPHGITEYTPAYGRKGAVTDDTQMTLFTAEGLIRALVRGASRGICHPPSVVAHAYQRWLRTQGERSSCDRTHGAEDCGGWLMQHPALHHRRAPGNTCRSALRTMKSMGDAASNDSKGCGGVMRVAPVGLMACHEPPEGRQEWAFNLAVELAALTHGHPTGSLPAGVFAAIIAAVAGGLPLSHAIAGARELLRGRASHAETKDALDAAVLMARTGEPPDKAIDSLGEGWVAEEALAIAVYCASVARDFRHGVILAVNHDGDSDSTGSMTGNLLGAAAGTAAIPPEWLQDLELREAIAELAGDLHDCWDWDIGEHSTNRELAEQIWRKYPGY